MTSKKALLKNKDTVIATNVKTANNIFTRTVGLLYKSSLPREEGLLIIPCRTIHSIFMRFTFDAVFISKEGEVVHLIERMKPFKATPIIWKAKTVLELAEGIISEKNIQLGDIIEFI